LFAIISLQMTSLKVLELARACNNSALELLQVWQPLVGVAVALLVALLAVRALGETDLNPVSGVGKLSQVDCTVLAKPFTCSIPAVTHNTACQRNILIMHCGVSQAIFAVLAPGKIVPNLVAGAIAEAGAQQAGDMMQDFKCVLALRMPCPALRSIHREAAALVGPATLCGRDAGAHTCLVCVHGSSLRPC
jgi:uncharacterized oligopeptide transporter (OPT) family protein